MNDGEDLKAAYGVLAVLLILKVVLGLVILLFLPVGEAASLYLVMHLSILFGIVPLGILFGASALFWCRVVRLRSRRRRFRWLEWHVE